LPIAAVESAKGLKLLGSWERTPAGPALSLTAHNGSPQALHNFMVQFNRNAMGLAPAAQAVAFGHIAPGATATAAIGTTPNQALLAPDAAPGTLQVRGRS